MAPMGGGGILHLRPIHVLIALITGNFSNDAGAFSLFTGLTMAQLTINLLEGSVSFSCSPETVSAMQGAIATLMQDLKATAIQGTTPGQRPQPKPSLDYCHTGAVFLELFCNPNIYPSPFAAKVLITLRDDKIRVSAEAELTRLIEDLNQYVEQLS